MIFSVVTAFQVWQRYISQPTDSLNNCWRGQSEKVYSSLEQSDDRRNTIRNAPCCHPSQRDPPQPRFGYDKRLLVMRSVWLGRFRGGSKTEEKNSEKALNLFPSSSKCAKITSNQKHRELNWLVQAGYTLNRGCNTPEYLWVVRKNVLNVDYTRVLKTCGEQSFTM